MTQTERVGLTFPRSGQQLTVNVPPHLAASARNERGLTGSYSVTPNSRCQTVNSTAHSAGRAQ